jgi:hypothetical protein
VSRGCDWRQALAPKPTPHGLEGRGLIDPELSPKAMAGCHPKAFASDSANRCPIRRIIRDGPEWQGRARRRDARGLAQARRGAISAIEWSSPRIHERSSRRVSSTPRRRWDSAL